MTRCQFAIATYGYFLPTFSVEAGFIGEMFLNQARDHSQPKASCGRVPGLLKLFYEKSVCVCVHARACVCVPIYLYAYLCMFVRIHPREQNFEVIKVRSKS